MACVEPGWNGNRAFGTTVDVTDPVQGGVLKNCSLIAGISSLALETENSCPSKVRYKLSNFYP